MSGAWMSVDVAVVGGGPAGSLCAQLLARRGLRVELWERRQDPGSRFPELLPPVAGSLLARLELDRLVRSSATACQGIEQLGWGPVRRETYLAAGWLLDRRHFDQGLRARARRAGVRWIPTAVRQVLRDDRGWRIVGTGFSSSARFLVDATGRSGLIARRFGANRHVGPPTLAVGIRFASPRARRWYLGVERVDQGWWYFADAADGTSAAVLIAPRERFSGIARERVLVGALGRSGWAREVRACGDFESKPRAVDATSRSRQASGPGWLAVGDAAACFDPIASQGLMHALSSAWCGSCALADALAGSAEALDIYAAAVHLTWRRTHALQRAIPGVAESGPSSHDTFRP